MQHFHITVIELACGEHGEDKIKLLTEKSDNGRALEWFEDPSSLPTMENLRKLYPLSVLREQKGQSTGDEETSILNQISVLIRRGVLKAKRDAVSLLVLLF